MLARGPLHVANCRFVNYTAAEAFGRSVEMYGADLKVVNSEFLDNGRQGFGIALQSMPGYRSAVRNCVFMQTGVEVCYVEPEGEADLEHNTFLSEGPVRLNLLRTPAPDVARAKAKPVCVRLACNIFPRRVTFIQSQGATSNGSKVLTGEDLEALLPRMPAWEESNNLHQPAPPGGALILRTPTSSPTPSRDLKSLADWKDLWQLPDLDAKQGAARFACGNLEATPPGGSLMAFRCSRGSGRCGGTAGRRSPPATR